MSQDDLGGKRHNRNSRDLADVGNRPRGSGVHLDNIYLILINNELNVYHSKDMQGSCQLSRVLLDLLFDFVRKASGRVNRNTVSGMNTRPLDMLHDTGDQDVLAVADSVNLDFLPLQILVYQNRMVLRVAVDHADILHNILVVYGNLHALSAENIGRADKNRITQLVGDFYCLFRRVNGVSRGSRNLCLLKDLVKELSVLRGIHVFGRSAENRDAHLHERLRQLDGRLASKLHHRAVRVLQPDDILHILRGERLKIQTVCNIKVGGNRFRIVVDDDSLPAFFGERPGRMYGTKVKLDALSDADRPRSEDQNLLAVMSRQRLVFSAVHRIIIRRSRGELRRAGVYHLIGSGNSAGFTHCLYICFGQFPVQLCDQVIRELHTFRLAQKVLGELLCFQRVLHLHQNGNFINKPLVNHGDLVDLPIGNIAADRLCNSPDPHIIHDCQLIHQLIRCEPRKIIGHQRIHMLFQRADRLHQGALKIRADAHDLTGRLHLRGQGSLRADEFVKRQTGNFHDAVVQHGLKARVGFFRNGIGDLVQCIPQGDFRGNLGNRIAGRLGRKRGRTADTGVYLYNAVFKAFRVQRVLDIAASGNSQL